GRHSALHIRCSPSVYPAIPEFSGKRRHVPDLAVSAGNRVQVTAQHQSAILFFRNISCFVFTVLSGTDPDKEALPLSAVAYPVKAGPSFEKLLQLFCQS